jgi:hypothetical protein
MGEGRTAMTYLEAESMRRKLEAALFSTAETKSPDNFKKVSKEYTADQWAECGKLILRDMEKDRLRFLKLLATAEILGVREGGGPALEDFCFNGAYREGYFRAVLAVVNWWEDHSDTITYYRYTNYKLVDLLLNKVLENWETLMKYGDVEVAVTREEYEGRGKKWHSRKNKKKKVVVDGKGN